ncbi:MAG: hypothetical protein U0T36_11200 [Saprospiraceae bacterium]
MFEKFKAPFYQLSAVSILTIVMIGLTSLLPAIPYAKTSEIMPWVVVCSMVLLFAMVNSAMSFQAENGAKYWMQSILSFGALLLLGSLSAWAVTGVTIYDAGSVSWIFMVLTFGYLILMSIVNLVKFLLLLSKQKDEKILNKS